MDIHRAAPEDLDRVSALLAGAALEPLPRDFPLSDVLVALDDSAVVGVIALEVHGLLGLIRSAVVAPGQPLASVASSLLQAVISRGNELSLRELYLFSRSSAFSGSSASAEDAEGFFEKAGFAPVPRADVPAEIRSTRQFREQGPDGEAVLRFQLAIRFV